MNLAFPERERAASLLIKLVSILIDEEPSLTFPLSGGLAVCIQKLINEPEIPMETAEDFVHSFVKHLHSLTDVEDIYHRTAFHTKAEFGSTDLKRNKRTAEITAEQVNRLIAKFDFLTLK